MAASSTTDSERVAALREALPAVAAGIYLNAPVAGPLPAESAVAMAGIAEWELRTGRAHRDRLEDIEARVDEARAAVAAILTTDLERVALAHGQPDAFARAVRSIDWDPGDVAAVVEDAELRDLAAALPATLRVVPIDPGGPLPAGTRLVALPIVSSATGRRLPVEAMAARAHEVGARVLAEASLAVGAIPIDPSALGADLLVARASAWLLGPEGLAVVAGDGVPGAGTGLHLPSVVGLARGCGWLSMYVGLPWLHARGAALTQRAADRVAAIHGVELLTPPHRATILTVTVSGWPADQALEELGGRIFLLASTVPELDAVRIGIGWWNTEDEIDRLADAIELLAGHTPQTMPRRPRLAMLGEP